MTGLWSPVLDRFSQRCCAQALLVAEQPDAKDLLLNVFFNTLETICSSAKQKKSLMAIYALIESVAPVQPVYVAQLINELAPRYQALNQDATETNVVDALQRLALAAYMLGVSGAIYNDLLIAVHPADPDVITQKMQLSVAQSMAAVSASRMALYETVRAADKGRDITLQSAAVAVSVSQSVTYMGEAYKQVFTAPSRCPFYAHASVLARLRQSTDWLAEQIQPEQNKDDKMSKSTKATKATSTETSDRVSEILDAAAEAFTKQSYDATSLDYIGDAIGVTKGSIYYHYSSKAELFFAVYRRAMELNIETVQPIAVRKDIRAIDRLYGMAFAHSLQVMKHLSYQRVAVQGLESHLMARANEKQQASLSEVIQLRDTYEELFVNVIKEAVTQGELPEQNAHITVKPFFGAINWTTMWYRPRENETAADREQIAAHLADFAVSGLTQSFSSNPTAMLAMATHINP